jgi:hypothetical protein
VVKALRSNPPLTPAGLAVETRFSRDRIDGAVETLALDGLVEMVRGEVRLARS